MGRLDWVSTLIVGVGRFGVAGEGFWSMVRDYRTQSMNRRLVTLGTGAAVVSKCLSNDHE